MYHDQPQAYRHYFQNVHAADVLQSLQQNFKGGYNMGDYQMRLKLVMLKISKMAGIEYTNDIKVMTDQLYEVGFLTDKEFNQIEQQYELIRANRIGLQQ